jgi:putative ABC transport system permease protein
MYHAVRGLLRRPLFTAAAVASLALGLGAITTVFSVVNALLLKPLPYRDAARLVAIWPAQYFANREIDAFRARARSYEEVASLSPGWLMALTDVTVPRQLNGAKVSGNLFAMLGAEPVVGRRFGMEAELPGEDKVALLSWELWQSSFNGDAAVVGRSIRLDREMYRVVGVMPAAFRPLGASSDLWVPMAMDETAMAWAGATTAAFGRLRPDVTPAMATSELNILAGHLQKEFSLAPNWSQSVAVVSLKESMVGAVRPTLLILFSAVAFLLLIASANVANLLLVRNAERRHELAVRASLGATPRDLARFIAAEGAVLGIAGAIAGLVVTVGGVGLLRRILPPGLPRLEEIGIDLRVVGAAVGFAVIATIAFALAPALQGKSAALAARLRTGRTVAGHGQRTRGLVVSAEIALALILTVGATLMGRTLVALNAVDPGLRADHLLTLRLQPSTASDDALRAYWSTVLQRVRGIPGVTSAGTVLHLPASGRKWMGPVEVEGRPLNPGESPVRTAWQSVSPEYLQTAGVPLVSGRPLSSTDGPNDPRVMLVNQTFARTFFAAEDPVGRRVKAGNGTQGQWTTIVGVVGNIRHDSLNVAAGPEIYVPFAQRTVVATALVVRTAGDPLRFAAPVRDAVWSVDRNVPISDVRTMDDLFAQSLSRQRMVLILLGLFAGVGLLLSGVGIYGVVAYGVRQRTRELGVRVALGADRAAIRALVLGQGVRYAAAGVLIGLPLALALSRLMRAMVFGVTTSDPASFVGVAMLLVGVALLASWIPARKAAAGDPTAILRD